MSKTKTRIKILEEQWEGFPSVSDVKRAIKTSDQVLYGKQRYSWSIEPLLERNKQGYGPNEVERFHWSLLIGRYVNDPQFTGVANTLIEAQTAIANKIKQEWWANKLGVDGSLHGTVEL